jgi:tetratricopeptide (TPR) repeat protein
MLRKIPTAACIALLLLLLVSMASGQKLEPPKLDSTPLTPQQQQLMKEGVALHDSRDYDGAISRYQEVLKANPNNAEALYEMAYAYAMKKDYNKSLEYAYKASQYRGNLLPLVYTLIGNDLDETGNSKKAIEVYKTGIKQLPANFMLHFNLAVAYARQGQLDEARAEVKKSAALNPKHTSSHFLLSTIFFKGSYRMPALLAASRFLALEPNSGRSASALQIVQTVMQGGVSQGKSPGEINIFVDTSPKKDEGDFSTVEMFIGLGKAASLTEKNKGKSEMQLMVERFNSLFAMLEESQSKADRSKFTWSYYVPYFLEMKRRGLVEPFVYIIHLPSNHPEVRQWLQQNETRVREFLMWSNNYQWPQVG